MVSYRSNKTTSSLLIRAQWQCWLGWHDSHCTVDVPKEAGDVGTTGADPENLHGRWLTGWLLIVNILVQRGWLVNNSRHLLYYVALKNWWGGWLATLSTPPPWISPCTTMSVEFDTTHQSWALLNLEQHCCAITLASPPVDVLMQLRLVPSSVCNTESG